MMFQRYDSYLDSDVPSFIALNANYYCDLLNNAVSCQHFIISVVS